MFAVFSVLRKLRACIAMITALFVLAACQTGLSTGASTSITPGAPVPVALLVPHGASNANEQKLARDLESAARLAVADLSGVQIDLRVYGTAGNAGQAQQAAQKAVEDGAKIIVGPLHAESANAVAVAVAPKGVNVLAFSNNSTIAGGNLFILGQTFQDTANRLTRYAVGQGRKRILTVHSNNLAGELGRQAIQQAISANGASQAGTVGYAFSEQSVIAAVPAIRTAAQQNSADAIFLDANSAGALPLFTQMLPEAGLSAETIQYIGLSRWDTPPQTRDLPGVQGGWFAMPDPQRVLQFKSRFQAANGGAPHPLAGLSYDAIAAIGALAQTGQSDAFSRGRLTQSAGFGGVNGIFRFLPNGTTQRGLAVATIQNRQVVVISPAPSSFAGSGF